MQKWSVDAFRCLMLLTQTGGVSVQNAGVLGLKVRDQIKFQSSRSRNLTKLGRKAYHMTEAKS